MEKGFETDFDYVIGNRIAENKPIIRIKKIEFTNFKNVEHGEIELNFRRKDKKDSDILGIYGPNGTGKSSVIEALAILKALMSGEPVPKEYFDFIAAGQKYAELKFVFDIKSSFKVVHEATYSFRMGKRRLTPDDPETSDDYRFMIYKEQFLLTEKTKHLINIDTSRLDFPYFEEDPLVSSVFAIDFLRRLDLNSIVLEILGVFRRYAKDCLYVVTAKLSESNSTTATPIYFKKRTIIFDDCKPTKISAGILNEVIDEVNKISCVLEKIAPGLIRPFRLRELKHSGDKQEWDTILESLMGGEYRLLRWRCESNNVKRIISILPLIIAVFNNSSVTVAIDDFDSGMFEYLLVKLIEVLVNSGKGQFIFTGHNLRLVEKLGNKNRDRSKQDKDRPTHIEGNNNDKENSERFEGNKNFLYFATSDPKKRYVRLSDIATIATNNNVKDVYLRQIKENKGVADETYSDAKEKYSKVLYKALTEAGNKE